MVEKQLENHNYIEANLHGLKKIRLRDFTEGSEHTGEALVFNLPSKDEVHRLSKILMNNKIQTKNLPDAYDWHFAGTWDHIIPKYMPEWFNSSIQTNEMSSDLFPFSTNLLTRSMAIMILVYMDRNHLDNIVKTLIDFDEA